MVDISSASFRYPAATSFRGRSYAANSVHRVIARALRDRPLRAEIEAPEALVYPLAHKNAVSNPPLLGALLESVNVSHTHGGPLICRQRRAEATHSGALMLDNDAVTLGKSAAPLYLDQAVAQEVHRLFNR